MALNAVSSILQIAVGTPYNLLEMATTLRDHIRNFCDNGPRGLRLHNLAEQLMERLRSAERGASPAALNLTRQELESVFQILQPITQRQGSIGIVDYLHSFFTASDEHSELQQAERKLENLMGQVVVVDQMLNLVPTICNESVELPLSRVGFDRAMLLFDFLEKSHEQDFRVIVIHGQPGVGKTTLLNYVWEEVSAKLPFRVRAYVQVGYHDATSSPLTIGKSQSSILWQLGGANEEFPSPDFGSKQLDKHFQLLKTQGKPLFLAIDNVFEMKDLENLLPNQLGSGNLPAFSCIALTCRNYKIVEALLRICRLQERDRARVFKFEPPCLSLEEGQRVFAECAAMQHPISEHQELLDELVPLCGGLPLALTVLGKVFVDESRREKAQWQLIKEQWCDLDDEDSSPVRKALELSFVKLEPSHQLAFLDVVSTFYGWWWERVERIVGVSAMNALKNSSLISKVDDIEKCNQSALRVGHDLHPWRHVRKGFVSMHDLTLLFGESTLYANNVGYKLYKECLLQDHQHFRASKLRHLIMSSDSHDQESRQQELIQNSTNLQMLVLLSSYRFENLGLVPAIKHMDATKGFLQATYCKKTIGFRQDMRQLRVAILVGWRLSQSIVEMKVSNEIRELILQGCGDFVQLPDTALPLLESLHIIDCPLFQSFPTSCVGTWVSLKNLHLMHCPSITAIPAQLGTLTSLGDIRISDCDGLEEFPAVIRSSSGPSSLALRRCRGIRYLGDMLCPLQSLHLDRLSIRGFELAHVAQLVSVTVAECRHLVKLPASIVNASSLQSLTISQCENLQELLPDDGEIGCNMTSLGLLSVDLCRSLRSLPACIFQKASSLKTLKVNWSGLVTLPAELGTLTCLTELNLEGCTNLVELPQQLGMLTSLSVLNLCKCEKLVQLPQQMGATLSSLTDLNLEGCKNLVELPQQTGMLTSLRGLNLCKCEKLKQLPQLMGTLTCLTELNLEGCRNLVELPQQLGMLTSLRVLNLRSCKKLVLLPEQMGCTLSSLAELNLEGCENLVELPQPMAGLYSLRELNLNGCKKLEKLPDSFASLVSLEKLYLNECDSLLEVPQQLEGLSSLKRLELRGHRNLDQLLPFFCTITSLESLTALDSEALRNLQEDREWLV